MSSILLLDLDHTLYPSTAPTLQAVDTRITRFIAERLNLDLAHADRLRREFCDAHGTTLRGLELHHGIRRDEYTDYIQDLEDHLMPGPDPALRDWLLRTATRLPTYIFTNARRDWADRCLRHLGIHDLLRAEQPDKRVLSGIFDIDFMDWAGKPHRSAFEKVEQHVLSRHPGKSGLVFADDRLENLVAARARGWHTVWVRPHDAPPGLGAGHHVVDRITELDPDSFLPLAPSARARGG